MPQPRKYESPAARQAAYRARHAAHNGPVARPGVPGYSKWRKQIKEACALLDEVYEEVSDWMQERSERWQDSYRAGDLAADKDELWTVIDTLGGLSVLASKE